MKTIILTALSLVLGVTSCDANKEVEVKNTAVQCSSVTNLQPRLNFGPEGKTVYIYGEKHIWKSVKGIDGKWGSPYMIWDGFQVIKY